MNPVNHLYSAGTYIENVDQTGENRLETILQTWLDDPLATGDKEEACDRIKRAHLEPRKRHYLTFK